MKRKCSIEDRGGLGWHGRCGDQVSTFDARDCFRVRGEEHLHIGDSWHVVENVNPVVLQQSQFVKRHSQLEGVFADLCDFFKDECSKLHGHALFLLVGDSFTDLGDVLTVHDFVILKRARLQDFKDLHLESRELAADENCAVGERFWRLRLGSLLATLLLCSACEGLVVSRADSLL